MCSVGVEYCSRSPPQEAPVTIAENRRLLLLLLLPVYLSIFLGVVCWGPHLWRHPAQQEDAGMAHHAGGSGASHRAGHTAAASGMLSCSFALLHICYLAHLPSLH